MYIEHAQITINLKDAINLRFTKFLRIDGLRHDAALGKVNRAGNPRRNNSGQHATSEMAKVTLLQKACRAPGYMLSETRGHDGSYITYTGETIAKPLPT